MRTSTELPSPGLSKNVLPKFHRTILGIRARLFLGFLSISIVFLIAIGITLAIVTGEKKVSARVVEVDLPSYDALIDLNSQTHIMQSTFEAWLLTSNARFKEQSNKLWDDIDRIRANLNNLSKYWTQAELINKWHTLQPLLDQLKSMQLKVESLTSKDASVQMFISDVLPVEFKLLNLLNNLSENGEKTLGILDYQSKIFRDGAQKIIDNLSTIQILGVSLSLVGIIAALLIALYTSKTILSAIILFRQHSSRIAGGDLTQYIPIQTNDELGQLGYDLNKMTEGLSAITKEITLSCHSMVSTAEEVRHAIDVQASGTSEQASSINQITASLSEIEKSSAQTMEKAKQLGESAEQTRAKGQLGLESVDQSVIGMKAVRDKVQMIAQTILDLSHKTQQVGEITAVVNNLAQQSKMLALNASIEAAKAGDAGKGFSVVAVEVRNLAEQSEHSTSQVQKILEDIRHAAEKAVMVTEEGTKGVDLGMSMIEQTGEIIRNLNDVIHETTVATQQIEAAVRQEGAGIEQITAGMNEINQVTVSSVEGIKQTTEAMSNLTNVAKNLKAQIETYKV